MEKIITHTAGPNVRTELAPNYEVVLVDGYKACFFDHIDDINDIWDAHTLPEVFSRSPYLKTIEEQSRSELENHYVLLTRDKKVVGTVLLQLVTLSLHESFQFANYSTDKCFLSRMIQFLKNLVIRWFKIKMLTVGNLYLTGQYAMAFADDSHDTRAKQKVLYSLLPHLEDYMKAQGKPYSGLLMKDYFEKQALHHPRAQGLYPFKIDPNMILEINADWDTLTDYLADMRSKYRIRLKNAMRKFDGITKRELSLSEVQLYEAEMYDMYTAILEGSGFVLARGDTHYFSTLKKQLGDKLTVIGLFLDDKMVGFYTWVLERGKMDSHFIGIQQNLNLRHQLYLNILLSLVEDSIQHDATQLYYYRTALEIKSSVGAEPHDMWCYYRHNNPILNKLVPWVFKYFVPQQKWQQRHPFKAQKAALKAQQLNNTKSK